MATLSGLVTQQLHIYNTLPHHTKGCTREQVTRPDLS